MAPPAAEYADKPGRRGGPQADFGAAALGAPFASLRAALLLFAAATFSAFAAGVAEVPRVVLGFFLGCCACALLRPPAVWRVEETARAKQEPFREAKPLPVQSAEPVAEPSPPAGRDPARAAAPGHRERSWSCGANTKACADDASAPAGAPRSEPLAPHVAGPGDGRSGRGQRRPRSSALCAQVGGQRPSLPDGCTMLVLSGLPRRCGQEQLAERLRGIGYRDDVDLVHLPVGLKTARHLGYAFLGFRTAAACARFAGEFHLACCQELFPDAAAAGVLEVAPSPCKGRAEYCKRFEDVFSKAKQSQRRPELLPLLLD